MRLLHGRGGDQGNMAAGRGRIRRPFADPGEMRVWWLKRMPLFLALLLVAGLLVVLLGNKLHTYSRPTDTKGGMYFFVPLGGK